MSTIHVIPDTNVLIHYTWFLEYPWHEHPEFTDKKVTIVFVKPVVQELDKHKDTHTRGNVRKCCRKVLGWLEANVSGKKGGEYKVSENLFVKLDLQKYSAHREARPDDQILEYAAEYGSGVTVVSADYTIRMTAAELGLRSSEPLKSERIRDEEKTELEETQKELHILQNRLPNLIVTAENGVLTYAPMELPFEPGQYWMERTSALMDAFPVSVVAFPGGFMFPTTNSLTKYEPGAIKKYEDLMGNAVRASIAYAGQLCRSCLCALEIRNEGTAFARHVEINLRVPEGARILPSEQVEFPEMPDRPQTRYADLARTILEGKLRNRQKHSGPNLRVSGSGATWVIDTLSHSKSIKLPRFYTILEETGMTEFGLEVSVLSAELPRPIGIQVPVRVTEPKEKDERKVKRIVEKLNLHLESPEEEQARWEAGRQ